jgi:hypothetical protein
MMSAPTCGDADCLLPKPRTINRFADLKAVLFLNSSLYFIPPAINAYDVCFSDENVTTDGVLSISRPSK